MVVRKMKFPNLKILNVTIDEVKKTLKRMSWGKAGDGLTVLEDTDNLIINKLA